MQRRTFIAAGAWLSAAPAFGMPWLRLDGMRADLALIDTALPESAALSDHAARMRLPVFDVSAAPHADIAALWYDTLAPRMLHPGGRLTLVGLTRAADFFVLARLALPPAAPITHARSVPQHASVAFALTA
ncbi:hypothetical protein [Paraburkholderia caribensis]|uniref:hypothetical protein n=1 Tax=Paraburkholderia caribensis TaxID=75105 RepID=UPI000722BFC4|nr:hypothetical protein [Paraburkholderia caribensis]ALP62735.1 hypothetical protein AN416_09090 [Paraburkholderia caribensis]AUT52032.1 hypothetical protein C2L66_09300 [Paraburkholderia caribensis]